MGIEKGDLYDLEDSFHCLHDLADCQLHRIVIADTFVVATEIVQFVGWVETWVQDYCRRKMIRFVYCAETPAVTPGERQERSYIADSGAEWLGRYDYGPDNKNTCIRLQGSDSDRNRDGSAKRWCWCDDDGGERSQEWANVNDVESEEKETNIRRSYDGEWRHGAKAAH